MKKPLPGQQNYFEAFIKAAQYFAGLTAQQDIWRETGKVLVNFFGAEVGALEGRRANAEAASHRWAFSERYSSRTDLGAEAGEAIAEVLESGFLSARIIFTPDPLSIACFPITQNNQVAAAMVVGHAMPKPLPRKLLNVYLALAGLVGTTVERLASEHELWRHRQQLQEKIAELRRAEEAQRRSERRMTILNRIANVFLTISDKEIYVEVLAVVLQVMKSQFGVFGFIETNGDLVIPSLTREIWNKCQVADKSYVFPQNTWGNCLWGRAIREKRALFSNGPFRTPEGHVPITCFLTAPVIFGNETIGLLSVANKESDYSEEDRKLLEGIAGYISPILNARLQRDQKEQERGRTEQALSESEALFRTSFENATVGICLVGIDGRFLNVNRKLCEVLGYMKEELNQIHFSDITYGEDKDIGVSFVKRALAGEIDHTDFEKRYLNKNGQVIWAHVSSAIIRTIAGEPQYFITHIQDITDRKAAEEALRQLNLELDRRVLERTAELEAANKELDAFAYSVSHDLRAPLRHIDGFLELLQKNAGAALDEQSRHYMDAISGSANKMGVLIDDLLSFSRMGRHAMSHQSVDLGILVHDIIRELAPDTAGRHIDWRIGDLPAVGGDAAMLRIVLVNLISNALKFTRPRQQARIEIGSQPGGTSEAVIFVRDNGVGFDMTYADKLFGVFQRLHRADEFEGTGIGLATVRRIIARHGGRTWAEGKAGQGATFYFSLPLILQAMADERRQG